MKKLVQGALSLAFVATFALGMAHAQSEPAAETPAATQQEAPAAVQQEAPAATQQPAPAATQHEAPAAAQHEAPSTSQQEAPAGADHNGTPHYPINHPHQQPWSFAGLFGTYDKAQLQRGLKVYKEVCSACHSMRLVAFRNLEDLGYTDAQVKAFASEYEVQDGPNAEGEMYTRKAVPSDYFPSPFPNHEAAQAANGGAAPPDMSLLAKARAVERGFPQFIFDMFWPYQEGGPDYIYSLLTGYQEPPAGVEVPEGTHYNPYFINGPALKMAQPLSDGQVTYDDDAPQTLVQYSHDVSAFLMWAAEPHLEERKRMGFMVILFLLGLTVLVYLTKQAVYSTKEH